MTRIHKEVAAFRTERAKCHTDADAAIDGVVNQIGTQLQASVLHERAKAVAGAAEPKPCLGCGTPTTGSVGAAGMRWPRVCQKCKDAADNALAARCIAEGRITRAIVATCCGWADLGEIDPADLCPCGGRIVERTNEHDEIETLCSKCRKPKKAAEPPLLKLGQGVYTKTYHSGPGGRVDVEH